jgi:hypothetical protein
MYSARLGQLAKRDISLNVSAALMRMTETRYTANHARPGNIPSVITHTTYKTPTKKTLPITALTANPERLIIRPPRCDRCHDGPELMKRKMSPRERSRGRHRCALWYHIIRPRMAASAIPHAAVPAAMRAATGSRRQRGLRDLGVGVTTSPSSCMAEPLLRLATPRSAASRAVKSIFPVLAAAATPGLSMMTTSRVAHPDTSGQSPVGRALIL